MNLAWSNSCNYVFGFSKNVTFSIRLVLKSARWHGVRILWKYHCSTVPQSENGPLLWPKTTTQNRKQSNWTDWLLFLSNKMWPNCTYSKERCKTRLPVSTWTVLEYIDYIRILSLMLAFSFDWLTELKIADLPASQLEHINNRWAAYPAGDDQSIIYNLLQMTIVSNLYAD